MGLVYFSYIYHENLLNVGFSNPHGSSRVMNQNEPVFFWNPILVYIHLHIIYIYLHIIKTHLWVNVLHTTPNLQLHRFTLSRQQRYDDGKAMYARYLLRCQYHDRGWYGQLPATMVPFIERFEGSLLNGKKREKKKQRIHNRASRMIRTKNFPLSKGALLLTTLFFKDWV